MKIGGLELYTILLLHLSVFYRRQIIMLYLFYFSMMIIIIQRSTCFL